MVPAFQRKCGTVCSILSSLLNPKGWEWAWQLCARLLNRTAARSQSKTLMEVARDLDLSFRPMDLRHNCFEQPGIFDRWRRICSKRHVVAVALGRLQERAFGSPSDFLARTERNGSAKRFDSTALKQHGQRREVT